MNLRLQVMILRDDDAWFAQGLQLDYAAQGSSVGEVRERFDLGLTLTIQEHLKKYGSIAKLIAAPLWVFEEFKAKIESEILSPSIVHDFEYGQIQFYLEKPNENPA